MSQAQAAMTAPAEMHEPADCADSPPLGLRLTRASRGSAPLDTEPAPHQTTPEDLDLMRRLREGDEAAFTWLVDHYHASLVRLARAYVADPETAEEVAQETWMGVLEGLERFEGRSSLRTWIFRILTNKAKTRGVRESRHVAFSAMPTCDDEADEPAVDPAQFRTQGHWTGYWALYPQPWDERTPEKLLLSEEATSYLERAIEGLPPNLRQVLILRDVEGLGSKEVCGMIGLSEGNQRVLLHRARSRVRRWLEQYFEGGRTAA